MPSYTYRCPNCDKFTVSQGIKEPALAQCPTCGSPVQRIIGRNVNIVYKCSGFYCTDTRPSAAGEGAAQDSSDKKAV